MCKNVPERCYIFSLVEFNIWLHVKQKNLAIFLHDETTFILNKMLKNCKIGKLFFATFHFKHVSRLTDHVNADVSTYTDQLVVPLTTILCD